TEVDPDTGKVTIERYVAVDDCGNVINPMIVDGQVHGGIAQSIGQALYEETVYDESGQLLTGTLVDYLVPAATEIPHMDISRTEGLSYVREDGDTIVIGALTRHVDLEASELLARRCRLLAETASHVGDVQVRNRGTIGGSLAHADPHGDLPAAVLALGGEVVATGSGGTRTIPVAEFFRDYMTTALEPGELLTEIRVP